MPDSRNSSIKRRLTLTGGAVFLAALVAIGYLFSPLTQETEALSVFLEIEQAAPGISGYRAVLINRSHLPIVIARCEHVDHAQETEPTFTDEVQVWQASTSSWTTVVTRRDCGDGSSKFARKLLWRGQQLPTASFFPNVGLSPFKRGDKVRFLVYISTSSDSEAVLSPEFVVE